MKKLLKYTALAGSILLASACTKGFEEMNDNDYTSGDMDPKYQFTFIQAKLFSSGHEGYRGNLIMAGPMSGISMNPQYTTGAGFNRSDAFTEATFSLIYNDIAKNIDDIQVRVSKDMELNGEENGAKLGQIAITKVVNYLRATMMYGDIPYSQAGKGYSQGILYPEYDNQEFVFEQMVSELKVARDQINDGSTYNEDFYYNGDASSWARLANSLLMKIGIFMSSADPNKGKEIFNEAYTNSAGYISSLAESAVLGHNESGGPWGQTVNGSGAANEGRVGGVSYHFFSDMSLESMQKRKDPRLFWVASHIDNSGSSTAAFTDVSAYTNYNPFAYDDSNGSEFKRIHYRGAKSGDRPDGNRGVYQKGDQVMYSAFTIQSRDDDGNYINNMGYSFQDGGQYAQLVAVNPNTILNATSPSMIMGSDEVHFMIAEAAERGWIGASSVDHFRMGIEQAIKKYPQFYAGQDYVTAFVDLYKEQTEPGYLWDVAVEEYITQEVNAYSSSANKLEDVIYQHWLSQIGNGYNAFAIWNRTHLPSIVPVNMNGENKDVTLPVYDKDPITDETATPSGTVSVELHTGGITNGIRPSRFPYPNREFTVNPTNVGKAVSSQEGGNPSSDFISAYQWMSFR
ncbi:SusD/RagB family nutrient-binding outer membrane lipoprotein [Flammeovirga pectinis]|uniref:SusD/RagB family nutrient-binding outer membrane lipoprotein n=1 Tax=Flammeovirga pectinis TaxID=2494373 RepID=A0A3S9P0R2_9BACT|nr:SusD/RagB family nutrient-binding outer membrane lipoprotein [Flammeovirga pectinis]AZQ61740.1 SusD/RagB family nutrient-binding outer membrane lipoprotein [Flammeovirga pectinis]